MKICTIKELLEAEVICGEDGLSRHVYSACGSDMMSDVLKLSGAKGLWKTACTCRIPLSEEIWVRGSMEENGGITWQQACM